MAIPLVAPWNGSSLYSSSEGIGSEPAELSHHQSCGCGGVERCNHDNCVGFCPDRAVFQQSARKNKGNRSFLDYYYRVGNDSFDQNVLSLCTARLSIGIGPAPGKSAA